MEKRKKNMGFYVVWHGFDDEPDMVFALRQIQIKSVKDIGFMV